MAGFSVLREFLRRSSSYYGNEKTGRDDLSERGETTDDEVFPGGEKIQRKHERTGNTCLCYYRRRRNSTPFHQLFKFISV